MSQEQPKTTRIKLTIVSVLDIQKIPNKDKSGTWDKLEISADDGNGNLRYFASNPSLFQYIQSGAVIDCDIETKVTGDFTNRKVTQIYQEGKPVAGEKKPFQGRSFESPELKRRSYALAYAKDMAVGLRIDKEDIITWATKFDKFLSGELPPATTEKIPPNNARKPATPLPTPDKVSGTDKPEGQPGTGKVDLKDMKFKNMGEFFTACYNQFGLTRSQVEELYPNMTWTSPDHRMKAWLKIIE